MTILDRTQDVLCKKLGDHFVRLCLDEAEGDLAADARVLRAAEPEVAAEGVRAVPREGGGAAEGGDEQRDDDLSGEGEV